MERSGIDKSKIFTLDAVSEQKDTATKATEHPYHSVFQYAPISIWREDFSDVKSCFDNLKKKGVHDFRTYFDKHPEAVLSLAQRVKIIEVNETTLKMFKAGSQEELYQGLSNVFSKHSYNVFREELIALSEGEREFFSEARNLTLTGEELHILIKVVVPAGEEKTLSNVFAYVIDISDLKRLEEDLKESEEKYRTIVETAHDAILVADVESGILIDANKKAEDLIGIPVDNIIGMHFTELHPKEDAERYKKFFAQHVERGTFVSDKLYVCNSKGERIAVSISSSVIYLHGKKCISGIFRQLKPAVRTEEEEISPALSRRECEIVKLIAEGHTAKQVADRLSISEKTVQTHRARIMDKLDIHKTADLVRYAVDTGLLEKSP